MIAIIYLGSICTYGCKYFSVAYIPETISMLFYKPVILCLEFLESNRKFLITC